MKKQTSRLGTYIVCGGLAWLMFKADIDLTAISCAIQDAANASEYSNQVMDLGECP